MLRRYTRCIHTVLNKNNEILIEVKYLMMKVTSELRRMIKLRKLMWIAGQELQIIFRLQMIEDYND